MSNPYMSKADYCFWSRAVTSQAPSAIDPLVATYCIDKTDKVATMGSCFAQHLSKYIQKKGFNYFVSEQVPDNLSASEASSKNYGVFSARYGNVYTVRQALQLHQRAFGEFDPVEKYWITNDKYYDPFRPQIEPYGFDSLDLLLESQAVHLECVRRIFLESDYLVFTLGLTEAFQSKKDGSVYPLAPGVAAGEYDETKYGFKNFNIYEVINDLELFINKLIAVNSGIKIILTVSPVPLIATYEDRHVLVSTTYSKSVLRTAADMMERKFDNVIYFPAYEIITSTISGGLYYMDDLRQVRDKGVAHVMRIFEKHFVSQASNTNDKLLEKVILNGMKGESEIICDEEIIERSVLNSL